MSGSQLGGKEARRVAGSRGGGIRYLLGSGPLARAASYSALSKPTRTWLPIRVIGTIIAGVSCRTSRKYFLLVRMLRSSHLSPFDERKRLASAQRGQSGTMYMITSIRCSSLHRNHWCPDSLPARSHGLPFPRVVAFPLLVLAKNLACQNDGTSASHRYRVKATASCSKCAKVANATAAYISHRTTPTASPTQSRATNTTPTNAPAALASQV